MKLNKRHRKRIMYMSLYENNLVIVRRKDGYGRLDSVHRYRVTTASALRLMRVMLDKYPTEAKFRMDWFL